MMEYECCARVKVLTIYGNGLSDDALIRFRIINPNQCSGMRIY